MTSSQSTIRTLHFLQGGHLSSESPCFSDCTTTLNALPISSVGALGDLARRVLRRDVSLDLVAESDAVAAASSGSAAASSRLITAVRSALRTLVFVQQGALKAMLSGAQVKEDLSTLGLNAERCDILAAAWDAESSNLIQQSLDWAVLGEKNALVDADLRFGVTVAMDDIGQVGHTFVQMRLSTTDAGGALQNRRIEMDISDFYKLLSAVETAQTYVTALEQ